VQEVASVADTPEQTSPKSAPSKLVPALLAVNSIAVMGLGAFLVLRHPAAAAVPAPPAASAEGGAGEEKPAGEAAVATIKLPEFTVRLHNPDAEHFIRCTFELELAAEKDRESVTQRTPVIRDAFISLLSDRTVEELQGSAALEKTKASLLAKLGELVGPKVRHLYITDLVVQ
jgi:flagellar basal body-associated protein FliL